MAREGYLAGVLADGARVFRYRSGVAWLLGQPDAVGPEPVPARMPGGGFAYPRAHGQSRLNDSAASPPIWRPPWIHTSAESGQTFPTVGADPADGPAVVVDTAGPRRRAAASGGRPEGGVGPHAVRRASGHERADGAERDAAVPATAISLPDASHPVAPAEVRASDLRGLQRPVAHGNNVPAVAPRTVTRVADAQVERLYLPVSGEPGGGDAAGGDATGLGPRSPAHRWCRARISRPSRVAPVSSRRVWSVPVEATPSPRPSRVLRIPRRPSRSPMRSGPRSAAHRWCRARISRPSRVAPVSSRRVWSVRRDRTPSIARAADSAQTVAVADAGMAQDFPENEAPERDSAKTGGRPPRPGPPDRCGHRADPADRPRLTSEPARPTAPHCNGLRMPLGPPEALPRSRPRRSLRRRRRVRIRRRAARSRRCRMTTQPNRRGRSRSIPARGGGSLWRRAGVLDAPAPAPVAHGTAAMSASTAIGMVSRSLRNLLLGEMRLDPPVDDVTVLSPDEPGSPRRVNLFLYRVEENEYLANQDFSARAGNQLVAPPMSLNLFYLMTVYSQNDTRWATSRRTRSSARRCGCFASTRPSRVVGSPPASPTPASSSKWSARSPTRKS